MTNNYMAERGHQIAMELIGTCKSIHETDATDDEQINIDFCMALDDEALECAECGWWYEPHQMEDIEGEYICEDCRS